MASEWAVHLKLSGNYPQASKTSGVADGINSAH